MDVSPADGEGVLPVRRAAGDLDLELAAAAAAVAKRASRTALAVDEEVTFYGSKRQKVYSAALAGDLRWPRVKISREVNDRDCLDRTRSYARG